MKKFLILFLIILVAGPVYPQKKRERVKRKYRRVETVNRELPQVYLWGKVRNQDGKLLQGASVVWIGSKLGVHTNTEGEYLLSGLNSGRTRIQVSLNGYKTKYTDVVLQDGINDLYFTLDKEPVNIEPRISTIQKREQQTPDIPSAMSIFNRESIFQENAFQPYNLAGFSPGFNQWLPNSLNTFYTFRGITQQQNNINENQGISILYNEISLNPLTSSSLQLFDMDRLEIHTGPQQVTSGIGAFDGAINYISKKPTEKNEGYLTGSYGNFGQKTVEGAVNVPVIGEYLLSRAAGFYRFQDGYVATSNSGNLNGINKYGGRFSLLVKPSVFFRFELEVNYQKEDEPGTAFLNPGYPNAEGDSSIFSYQASLSNGDSLWNRKELFNSILNARYYISEHTYLSSITSYQIHSVGERWDGDGTTADALNITKNIDLKRFTQELRLNFTRNTRLNGFGGASYIRDNATQQNLLASNEQQLFYLFNDPANLIGSEGSPNSISTLPDIADTPLPAYHQEEKYLKSVNQWYQVFGDATLNAAYRLRLTGGLRIAFNRMKLSHAQNFSGGSESVLGMENAPNLYYMPTDTTTEKITSLAIVYRGGFNYKFNPDGAFYGNYSLGIKPRYLNFQNSGEVEKIPAEQIHNFELGFKGIYKSRLWFDASAFYTKYSGFLSSFFTADSTGTVTSSFSGYAGKATLYGVETHIDYAIIQGIRFLGNYTWTKSKIEKTGQQGDLQELSGNPLRLAPEHSFAAELELTTPIGYGMNLFASPEYSYKTGFYFNDAQTEGLFQKAYGVLNARAGIHLESPDITFQIYGRNLLNEKYALYRGTPGELSTPALAVPSPPRMLGASLTWNFSVKEKPYYKRRR